MRKAVAFLFLALALTVGLQAHDPSKHKGKPVKGQIASLSAKALELKTETGVISVEWTRETTFEHGEKAVTKEHLKEGQQLAVIGTRLPGNRLVAKEILILKEKTGDAAARHSHHNQH